MRKHYNIKINGEVQDVGFRWAAKEQADKRGVVGLAQNLPDGTLYIEAEGEAGQLDEFVKWCQRGPTFASVKNVDFSEAVVKNFPDFNIIV
jgi:acylphosphatase